jgi:hypothetical protein
LTPAVLKALRRPTSKSTPTFKPGNPRRIKTQSLSADSYPPLAQKEIHFPSLYALMRFHGFQRFVSALEGILLPDESPIADMPRIKALPISKDRLQKPIIRGSRRGTPTTQPLKPMSPQRFQSIKPPKS